MLLDVSVMANCYSGVSTSSQPPSSLVTKGSQTWPLTINISSLQKQISTPALLCADKIPIVCSIHSHSKLLYMAMFGAAVHLFHF